MYCSECGVRADGKFCFQCGSPLYVAESNQSDGAAERLSVVVDQRQKAEPPPTVTGKIRVSMNEF